MSFTTPTRRAFPQGGIATFDLTSLMGRTALAAIDLNSHTARIFTAAHCGPPEASCAMASSSASVQ